MAIWIRTRIFMYVSYGNSFPNNLLADMTLGGLDFSPDGELVATIADHGGCILSNLDTNKTIAEHRPSIRLSILFSSVLYNVCFSRTKSVQMELEYWWADLICQIRLHIPPAHRRWKRSSHHQPSCTWKRRFINCFFFERLLLFLFYFLGFTYWIQPCPSNGNLLVTGGTDQNIKIFDRREAKVVRIFYGIHTGTKFW